MNKKRIIAIIAMLILLFNLISCGKEEDSKVDVASMKQKYYATDKATYTEPIYNVSRDKVFELDMSKEVADKYKDKLNEAVGVYLDVDKKMEVKAITQYDEKAGKVKLEAPKYPVFYNEDDFEKSKEEYTVNDDFDVEAKRSNKADWGNANNFYIVKNIDLKTGKKLDKPEITVFTVKPELKSPTMQFTLSKDGRAGFKWSKVEGANKYIVYRVVENKEDKRYSLYQEAITKETKYDNYLGVIFDFNDTVVSSNSMFRKIDAEGKERELYKYCVMAVTDDKKSLISNIIDAKDYASKAPVAFDEKENQKLTACELKKFPTHLYVKMGDGSSVLYPIDFDTKNFYVDYNHKNEKLLGIRYRARGTSLTNKKYYLPEGDDEKTKEFALKELKVLQERQDGIKSNALSAEVAMEVESAPPSDVNGEKTEKPDEKKKEEKVRKTDSKIYATSALSEYLALNMLSGVERINVKDFPEVSNKKVLEDAFYEAYYQNPLIMNIDSLGFDYKTNEVIVKYGQTAKEQEKMQKDVKKEVNKIVKSIIKEGMTPLQKEMVINDYLCESAKYDDAALESAMANNMIPDKKFNPSFTPYGVLVNKVGVCASYAGAFKLLADEAGLESIVVTGNLNGDLPHAWNRVKLDKEWLTVDTTNNDNELMPNGLLNLPDDVSKTVLVEDKRYILDEKYGTFTAKTDEKEYYKVKKQFFPKDKVVDELAKQLKEKGEAIVRTDYSLSQDEATKLAGEACVKAGVKELEEGYSWIGIIKIKAKK